LPFSSLSIFSHSLMPPLPLSFSVARSCSFFPPRAVFPFWLFLDFRYLIKSAYDEKGMRIPRKREDSSSFLSSYLRATEAAALVREKLGNDNEKHVEAAGRGEGGGMGDKGCAFRSGLKLLCAIVADVPRRSGSRIPDIYRGRNPPLNLAINSIIIIEHSIARGTFHLIMKKCLRVC